MINLQNLDGWKGLNSLKSFNLSSKMSQNNDYILENSEGNVLSFLDSDIAQKPSESKIYCKCGCGKEIIIKEYYKYSGIPDYIHGHNNRNKTYEELYRINKANKLKEIRRIAKFGNHIQRVLN